jgi:hypothetical protein
MRKAPGLFPALLVALFMPLLTAGCASSGRADVNQRVDVAEQNQQTLDLRVGRVEERLSRIEKKEEGGKPVLAPAASELKLTTPKPVPVQSAPAQTARSAERGPRPPR